MEAADIFTRCNGILDQIASVEIDIQTLENRARQIQSEISHLNDAKIGLRIEFGQHSKPGKITEMENALQEIDKSINEKQSELFGLVTSLQPLESELRRLNSAFNSFGCFQIRRT